MIEWQEGAVCHAVGRLRYSTSYVVSELTNGVTSVDNYKDFQLNEIRVGDYIEKSELDTEQKYNAVVKVFGLFGFKPNKHHKGYTELIKWWSGVEVYNGELVSANSTDGRKLTYNQIIAIGKLKRMMDEKSAVKSAPKATTEVSADNLKVTANKYEREISDRQGNIATVDVYDVLKAFNVTCPATQHAVKKLLCSGIRGHKDLVTDLIEARESIVRAIELNEL